MASGWPVVGGESAEVIVFMPLMRVFAAMALPSENQAESRLLGYPIDSTNPKV